MTPLKHNLTLDAKSSFEYSQHKNEKDLKLVRLLKGVVAFLKGLLGLYKVNVLSETARRLTEKYPHASYAPIFKALYQRSVAPTTHENYLTKMSSSTEESLSTSKNSYPVSKKQPETNEENDEPKQQTITPKVISNSDENIPEQKTEDLSTVEPTITPKVISNPDESIPEQKTEDLSTVGPTITPKVISTLDENIPEQKTEDLSTSEPELKPQDKEPKPKDEPIPSATPELTSEISSQSEIEEEFSPAFFEAIEKFNQFNGENITHQQMEIFFNTLESEIVNRSSKSYSCMLDNYFTTFLHLVNQDKMGKQEGAANTVIAERLINLGFSSSNKETREKTRKKINNIKNSDCYHLKKFSHYCKCVSNKFSIIRELAETLFKNVNNIFFNNNKSEIFHCGDYYIIHQWLGITLEGSDDITNDDTTIDSLTRINKMLDFGFRLSARLLEPNINEFFRKINIYKEHYSHSSLIHYKRVLSELITIMKKLDITLDDQNTQIAREFIAYKKIK